MKTKLSKPTISFFCPAYNDEGNLPVLIPKAIKVFKKIASKFEILIIEDGSPDKTAQVADKLAIKYSPYVRVIHHKKNKGYGATLAEGFSKANKYAYVCYTDGDVQFDVADYERAVPLLKKYDAVIGYRKTRNLSKKRLAQTIVYNALVHVFFNTYAKDINCSIKIIKRSIMDKIHLTSESAFIDAEILINLQRMGAKVKQIPATSGTRLSGEASGGKPSVITSTFFEMYRFWKKGARKS